MENLKLMYSLDYIDLRDILKTEPAINVKGE